MLSLCRRLSSGTHAVPLGDLSGGLEPEVPQGPSTSFGLCVHGTCMKPAIPPCSRGGLKVAGWGAPCRVGELVVNFHRVSSCHQG